MTMPLKAWVKNKNWEKKDANIVVDSKRYDKVLKFQTGESVVKKIRENIEHAQSGYKEGQSLPD